MNDTIALIVNAAIASGGGDVLPAMIEAVSSLSPVQVAAALGALAWGVCGLAIARIFGERPRRRVDVPAIDPSDESLGEEDAVSADDFSEAA